MSNPDCICGPEYICTDCPVHKDDYAELQRSGARYSARVSALQPCICGPARDPACEAHAGAADNPDCLCGAYLAMPCPTHPSTDASRIFPDFDPAKHVIGAARTLRLRANISTTSKGLRSYDCTIEGTGYSRDELLEQLDALVAELETRCKPEVTP